MEQKNVIPIPEGLNANGGAGGEQWARDIAARYRCEFIDLRNYHLDAELFKSVPVDLMFRYNFIPLEVRDGTLWVALPDPSKLMMIDEIALLLDRRVKIKVATLAQINDILKKTEQSQRVLEEEKRASDIHVETESESVQVKYRIDGVLQQAMAPMAKEHHSTIITRIKVMSELDIAERRVPQDGRFRVKYNNRLIDFRVSIMPTIHGENAVLRVLDKESMSEKFRNLVLDVVGFDDEDLRRFRHYIAEPYGMVLVTGPTGSGKTTTLYAALNEIKSDEDKIITIEDPVEYQIRGVTQIPVNEKKGLTFARGLRSILRHDPDKIMVGEIRDTETAQIAIQSALTGHLVFTTVHANNVVDVLGRFLNMGVEPYNFVSALNCVLAQRLVRVICPHCSRKVQYSDEALQASGLVPQEWRDVEFREGKGCIECGGTGYHGRTAIHELLDLTDRIRELILEKRPSSEIRRAAHDEGMRFLRESALTKVKAGTTTLKEINKVTFIETTR